MKVISGVYQGVTTIQLDDLVRKLFLRKYLEQATVADTLQ